MDTVEDRRIADLQAMGQPAECRFAGGAVRRERYQVATIAAFGIWQSILLFGYKQVPISDFTAIFQTGHELLSLKVPTSFTRAPVVGMLQAALSHAVGGPHPGLTAGWLLSGLVYPCSLVLLVLLGRRIVGTAAVWLALLVALNPSVLRMLMEPLIEIPLLFFSLWTAYLIVRRSRWRYVVASMTSMVRYEGAALILAAFVMDTIEGPDRKRRIKALLCSAIASVPLATWLAATLATWRPDSGHYVEVMLTQGAGQALGRVYGTSYSLWKHLETLWVVSIRPLLMLSGSPADGLAMAVWQVSKGAAACGLIAAAYYGLRRRRPVVLVLLMFAVPYFLVHVAWSFRTERHYVAIVGIAVLLCWFGFQELRGGIIRLFGVRRRLDAILQACVVAASVAGIVCLAGQVVSPPARHWRFVSMSLPALTIVGLMFAGRAARDGRRVWLREGCIVAAACFFILSSQVSLGRILGDRHTDIEFKRLAEWYVENAGAGEKMLTTMPTVVALFVPGGRDRLVHIASVQADSPEDFVRRCRREGVDYVAWDSRLGLSPESYHYGLWGLENIAGLAEPSSNGDYEFITRVGVYKQRYINIFRVRPSAAEVPDGSGQDK